MHLVLHVIGKPWGCRMCEAMKGCYTGVHDKGCLPMGILGEYFLWFFFELV